MSNNAYLLRCTATGEGLLIDAANEADRLRELIRLDGPPVAAILTTHQHRRPLGGAGRDRRRRRRGGVRRRPRTPTRCRSRSTSGSTTATRSPSATSRSRSSRCAGTRRARSPCSTATPTGINHLFTGDSLFPGGVGRTTSPADFTSLLDDVEQRVFDVLDDATWFYPGHGDDSTLGVERPHLAEWRERGW